MRTYLITTVIALLCGSVMSGPVSIVDDQPRTGSSEVNWDFLLFVQLWPGSACLTSKCGHIPSYITYFTIHGIWPNDWNGSYPAYCNSSSSDTFNLTEVEDLVPALRNLWVSYEGTSASFWAHEWNKHGSCASSDPLLTTQHQFFSTALKLRQQIDLLTYFLLAGITPADNTTYSYSQLSAAITSQTHAAPALQCVQYEGYYVLNTVAVCLDKDLQMISCPKGVADGFASSCGDGSEIGWPLANFGVSEDAPK